MSGDLDGRHALITGGASGIGLATARMLSDHGARVTLVGRSTERLESAVSEFRARHRAQARVADVTDEHEVNDAFESAAAAFGPVTILVNSAGIAESAPFSKTDAALWNRHIATNLTGPFFCCKAVEAGMRRDGWGRIVTISSVAGLRGGAYIAAYCASKHGVIGLTRALAVEFAKAGITVNAVCPGYVDTPMTDASVANIAAKTGLTADAARSKLAGTNPQGRLLRPAEVAESVVSLCLPGSDSVTGQAIVLPGDEAAG